MIKMKQLVSVLMPSYNCGKWIEDSIKSVLEQDYKELELIIIDDNSSDNTHQIIQKFQENEQRRLLLHKMPYRTKNIAKLLNIGFQLAKGDVIVRQDADDFSFHHRINSQLKFLTDKNILICGSLFYVVLPNGNLLEDKVKIQKIYTSCNDEFSPPLHGTWMMKKSLIDIIGMYDESFPYAQDYAFICRTA
ncbi:glycosyl transferase family protein, partial [Candidatus Magnetomorum sp. HK-1]